jgi:hypothetical protein
MFCYNCGKELDDKAVVCIGCGVSVAREVPKNNSSTGKGVASFVLGILSVVFSSLLLINFIIIAMDYYGNITTNLIFTLFTYSLSITGLTLAVVERKTHKNGINTAGLVLNIISTTLATLWLPII